eukprot:gene7182-biopygen4124
MWSLLVSSWIRFVSCGPQRNRRCATNPHDYVYVRIHQFPSPGGSRQSIPLVPVTAKHSSESEAGRRASHPFWSSGSWDIRIHFHTSGTISASTSAPPVQGVDECVRHPASPPGHQDEAPLLSHTMR